MIIQTFRYLKYVFIAFATISLSTGCTEKTQLKPWDTASKAEIDFTFTDTDMDKGEIGGGINLNLPARLKPSGVAKYAIYWSGNSASSGKGGLLAEVSANRSGTLLYTVPENTKIPENKGSYFLLYLKAADGQEVWSNLSVAVNDKFAKTSEDDEPAVQSDTPQQQADQSTDGPQKPDEPTDTPTMTDTDKPAADSTPDDKPDVVTSSEPTQQSDGRSVIITIENVLFEFDRSYLKSEFKEQLRRDFADVEDKMQQEIMIEGHADERGSNEYNLALGERRAYAVKRYLISLGFASDNIRIISYGEEKPLEMGHNEAAWEKNRRAETRVLGQDE